MELYHFVLLVVLLVFVIAVCIIPGLLWLFSPKYREELERAYEENAKAKHPLVPGPAQSFRLGMKGDAHRSGKAQRTNVSPRREPNRKNKI